jgi:dTDP-3,4-didehydro-2,6-dideoxy-alpha-D-glucose 3-reductase
MSGSAALRMGVLGCADVAARRVLPAMAAVRDVVPHAVASRTPNKAAALAGKFGARPVTGYEALLDADDIDAVYLPLPSGLHAEWIERALLAGKHVLAEKPLTTTAADTERLLELAARQGLVLAENFMFPRHSQHAAIGHLLADGAIGRLRALSATFAIPARPRDDIRHRAELGGGALLDVAGYPLRAAQMFLGTKLTVAGAALDHDGTLGVDLGGAAVLAGDGGVTATLTFGLQHAYTARYQILGSTGRLTLDHAFTPPAAHRPVVLLERQDRREEITLPADDQYARSVEFFACAVRGEVVPDTETTIAQARLVDEIRAGSGSR